MQVLIDAINFWSAAALLVAILYTVAASYIINSIDNLSWLANVKKIGKKIRDQHIKRLNSACKHMSKSPGLKWAQAQVLSTLSDEVLDVYLEHLEIGLKYLRGWPHAWIVYWNTCRLYFCLYISYYCPKKIRLYYTCTCSCCHVFVVSKWSYFLVHTMYDHW